jgi:hypothetical protein
MNSTKFLAILIACALTGVAGAQTINKTTPPVLGFVDISMTGGTAFTGVDDETEHAFTTTIGNPLFPAGPVLLGCNGVVQSGVSTGTIGFSNTALPVTGTPTNLIGTATGSILAFWDDLDFTAASSTNVYWQETGGVLYIMWKNISHFSTATLGEEITFEIQVFSNPAPGSPWIQILYPDAVFGGSHFDEDNGLSATIGYLAGLNTLGSNAQFSHNEPVIFDGDVVTIVGPMGLAYSSPLGPGSIQVDLSLGPPSGTYFLVITLAPGAFPDGWFYGIDVTIPELISQGSGFPFVGALNGSGAFTLGPIPGAPPITVYSVALGFTGSGLSSVPLVNSSPVTYTIP